MNFAYTVVGKNASGIVSLRRDTVVGAIKKAEELIGDRHIDVQITAPDGQVYGHADFQGLNPPSAKS